MHVKAIKTHLIQPGELLEDILDRHLLSISEQAILVITSKIISICQGRVLPKTSVSKEALIKQEANAIAQTEENPYGLYLTIKDNILIPSAGIDESNGDEVYILYPKDIQNTAIALWNYVRKKHSLEHLGVIITDSHTTPLRRGVTGIALGWCGFEPLYSYVGKTDLYDKSLRVTQINLLDALATSSVLVMGEGNEQTPLAVINDAPKISFLSRPPTPAEEQSILIPMEEDLYAPLLMGTTWLKP
ncbi:MAG: putative folate metabolism gamma-glutamate ligase [Alphaproteobacteria bacterium]|nr:putative folate metabolism gamma-glutamate ligase [Alphaproteobacteria bacterium]